ncbi:hypothetical protein LHK94_02550 [Dickeya zeae]|uniref:hypothetical protein n=1 Tax=Dickeya zeae TaxID=204042 RepID=UPI001CFA409E|nr:hypothetical protein [Dickeya zeae]UCZ75916.1 hypothetical protein LHK94_02550 [Dickeya zeae]
MKRRDFLAGSLATVVSLPFYVRSEKWVAEADLVSTAVTPSLNLQHGIEPTVLLADSTITQQATTLSINLVAGTLVNFSYHTLTGNQPAHYQNQVFLWPVSDNEIPWSSPAIAQGAILLNQPDGDQNLDNIAISSGAYILGYAVGPEYAQDAWSRYLNVVASAYIPALLNGGYRDDTELNRCSITPAFVGVSSIACNFSFLPGFNAKASASWIGVWEGETVSWTTPPKWFSAITVDSNTGTVGINEISIVSGQKYTLALYTSGYDIQAQRLDLQRLACTATFLN